MFKLNLILVLSFTTLNFSAALRCYDCEPTSEGNCRHNVTNSRSVVCTGTYPSNSSTSLLKKDLADIDKTEVEGKGLPTAGLTYECYALYFKAHDQNENKLGIYRGCKEKARSTVAVCDLLKEEIPHGEVVNCQSCNADNCNTFDLPGGAASVSVSLAFLMISLLFTYLTSL